VVISGNELVEDTVVEDTFLGVKPNSISHIWSGHYAKKHNT
jgi:hypothetical protein